MKAPFLLQQSSITSSGISATDNTNSCCHDDEGDNKNDDASSVNSADIALCELLGLSSLDAVVLFDDDKDDDVDKVDGSDDVTPANNNKERRSLDDLLRLSDASIRRVVAAGHPDLTTEYRDRKVCTFPPELSVPADVMRRLTDELVWGGDQVRAARSYETVQKAVGSDVGGDGALRLEERRVLTRLENLNDHPGWNGLCNNYIRRLVSVLVGQDVVLYKTKVNLKPAGGSGYAPHVDGPSLRVAYGDAGPQNFVTVMIASTWDDQS
jgi:hypothetical protein